LTRTVVVWRIAAETTHFEADDASGKGAEKTGGRWNRAGIAMLYASTSRALACLETIVHLGAGDIPLNRYLVEIALPKRAWDSAVVLQPSQLVGWDALPYSKTSMDWGTKWAMGKSSLLAKVPSIVVPEEFNVLINPTHPDISRLKVTKLRRWTYDARMRR
jgi:RES domain-containing protein